MGDRAGEEGGKTKENEASKKEESIKILKQCQHVSKQNPLMTRKCCCGI